MEMIVVEMIRGGSSGMEDGGVVGGNGRMKLCDGVVVRDG